MADRYVETVPQGPGHRSTGEIVQDIANSLGDILRSEFRLAKTELSDRSKKFSKAAGVLAFGLVLLACAGALLIATATAALAVAIPIWAACLVMAFLLIVVGGSLALVGRDRLKRTNMRPQETIRSIREDVEWLKRRAR